jgi:NAD+ kinase
VNLVDRDRRAHVLGTPAPLQPLRVVPLVVGHGFVVSFIAPHSLTARTLVVAPDDRLAVHNRSQEEAVDVSVDGRPICVLEAGGRVEASFVNGLAALAQIPGTSFYQRLRQKFGRLATPL